MNEKVSVIIPVKKIDKYFYLALNSIINQTYQNIEILIVVDKGYEKEMLAATSTLKKKEGSERIVIVNSNLFGIAAALNVGIQKSKGTYIARMDSDDISELSRIEKQINYFKANASCQVLGSRAKFINEDGKPIGTSPQNPKNKNIKKLMYLNNLVIHPSVMINADFIRKIGGYSNQPSEDYEMWLRCLELDKNSIAILDEELIQYRIHQNQISKTTRTKGQTAVCNALFAAMLRKINIFVIIGLTFNITKLVFRKIQNFFTTKQ